MLPALPCDIDERYTIVAELGHGAHAIVYRAIDRTLDREVAVKVLRSELVGSDIGDRFKREIRLTSRLEHPNIAHVYGTGEFLGSPYFVIELARGQSLAERLLRERQLPIEDALAIARQVASALGHAHRSGVVHRDVKPANVLLTEDGALLTDFGVARAFDGAPGTLVTSTGVAVGTLLYMSPEQLCAERDIDARSDQYALALMLYEMLAGVPPHFAANAEGLRALRIAAQHVPVRTLRASVPDAVDTALLRAMASSPADRFNSVTDFVASFEGATQTVGSRADAMKGSRKRRVALAARSRAVAGLAVIGTVALLSAGGVYFRKTNTPLADAAAPDVMSTLRFSVSPVGDTLLAAPVARALNDELNAWPDVVSQVSSGVTGAEAPLEIRLSRVGSVTLVTVRLPGRRRSTGHASARSVSTTLPVAATPDADSLRVLAARVMMAGEVAPDSVELPVFVAERATMSVRRYAQGWRALLTGELGSAEQAFSEASRTASLPQAALWRTIVASWRQPRAPSVWRDAAQAAVDQSARLSPRDSLLAHALLDRATDRMVESCEGFTRATRIRGGSFAAWYGLADCLQTDSIVVAEAASPTGMRFRTSYWGAAQAMGEALPRLPSAQLASLFSRLPSITFALNSTKRTGALERGEGPQYAGLPSLVGDSVTVFPMPARLLASGAGSIVPRTYQRAVRRGRQRLLQLTGVLAERAEGSLAARLAYARALEYVGTLTADGDAPSALKVLADALRFSRTGTDSLDVGIDETRVRLRIGDFHGARLTAASLLIATGGSVDAERLVPLAVLIGDMPAAESLLARALTVSPERPDGVSRQLAALIARYSVAAARGDCAALASLRAATQSGLASHYAESELATAQQRWLGLGDWMRLTCPGAPIPPEASPLNPTISAAIALRAGSLALASARIRRIAEDRVGASASAVAWDTRFRELWILVQARDTSAARQQLKAALDDLGGTMDYVLYDLTQSAGLRRSLALCDSISSAAAGPRVAGSSCGTLLRGLSP